MYHSKKQVESDNEYCSVFCPNGCKMLFHSLSVFDQHSVLCTGETPEEAIACQKCSVFIFPDDYKFHAIISHQKFDNIPSGYKRTQTKKSINTTRNSGPQIAENFKMNKEIRMLSSPKLHKINKETGYDAGSSDGKEFNIDKSSVSSLFNRKLYNRGGTQYKQSKKQLGPPPLRNILDDSRRAMLSCTPYDRPENISVLNNTVHRPNNPDEVDMHDFEDYMKFPRLSPKQTAFPSSSNTFVSNGKYSVPKRNINQSSRNAPNDRLSFLSRETNKNKKFEYKSYSQQEQNSFLVQNATKSIHYMKAETDDIDMIREKESIAIQRQVLELREAKVLVEERLKEITQRENRTRETEYRQKQRDHELNQREERLIELQEKYFNIIGMTDNKSTENVESNQYSSVRLQSDSSYFSENDMQPVTGTNLYDDVFDRKVKVGYDLNNQPTQINENNLCDRSLFQLDSSKVRRTYSRSKSISSSDNEIFNSRTQNNMHLSEQINSRYKAPDLNNYLSIDEKVPVNNLFHCVSERQYPESSYQEDNNIIHTVSDQPHLVTEAFPCEKTLLAAYPDYTKIPPGKCTQNIKSDGMRENLSSDMASGNTTTSTGSTKCLDALSEFGSVLSKIEEQSENNFLVSNLGERNISPEKNICEALPDKRRSRRKCVKDRMMDTEENSLAKSISSPKKRRTMEMTCKTRRSISSANEIFEKNLIGNPNNESDICNDNFDEKKNLVKEGKYSDVITITKSLQNGDINNLPTANKEKCTEMAPVLNTTVNMEINDISSPKEPQPVENSFEESNAEQEMLCTENNIVDTLLSSIKGPLRKCVKRRAYVSKEGLFSNNVSLRQTESLTKVGSNINTASTDKEMPEVETIVCSNNKSMISGDTSFCGEVIQNVRFSDGVSIACSARNDHADILDHSVTKEINTSNISISNEADGIIPISSELSEKQFQVSSPLKRDLFNEKESLGIASKEILPRRPRRSCVRQGTTNFAENGIFLKKCRVTKIEIPKNSLSEGEEKIKEKINACDNRSRPCGLNSHDEYSKYSDTEAVVFREDNDTNITVNNLSAKDIFLQSHTAEEVYTSDKISLENVRRKPGRPSKKVRPSKKHKRGNRSTVSSFSSENTTISSINLPNKLKRKRGRPRKASTSIDNSEDSSVFSNVSLMFSEETDLHEKSIKEESSDNTNTKFQRKKRRSYIFCKKFPGVNWPSQCGQCEKVLNSSSGFYYHALKCHAGLARPLGESQLFEDDGIRLYLLKEAITKNKVLVCAKCNKHCKSFLGYDFHIKMCGKTESEKYQECPECKESVRLTSMPKHRSDHKKPSVSFDESPDEGDEVSVGKPRRNKSYICKEMYISDDDTDEEYNIDKSLTSRSSFTVRRLAEKLGSPLICKLLSTKNSTINDVCGKILEGIPSKCLNTSCKEEFKYVREFRKHLRACKYSNFVYLCRACRVSSVTLDVMEKHITIHCSEDVLKSYLNKCPLINIKNGYHSVRFCHEFRAENYVSHLFTEIVCKIDEWKCVQGKVIEMNKKNTNESVPFKFSTSETNTDWITLPAQGCFSDKQSCTIFAGSNIITSAWCPLPERENIQYIALSCKSDNLLEISYTIQIWAIQVNTSPNMNAEMMFSFRSKNGIAYSLKWCPSGAYQVGEYERLGILATSCSDGSVCMYAIPHPHQLPRVNALYEKRPDLVLAPFDFIPFEFFCRKIDWFTGKGHEYVAACYSNGFVAIFNLMMKGDPWLNCESDGTKVLRSSIWFRPHLFPCTTISFCPNTKGKHILTAALDRITRIWDLDFLQHPLSDFRKGVVTDSLWVPYWSGVVLSFDESIGIHTVGTVYKESDFSGGQTISVLPTEGTVWCLAASDWYNGITHGSETGVSMSLNHKATLSVENSKAFHKCRISVFETTVEEVTINSCDSRKKFGICFYDDCLNVPKQDIAWLCADESKEIVDRKRICSTICWNNNYGGQNLLFVGQKCGLGRIIDLSSLKHRISA